MSCGPRDEAPTAFGDVGVGSARARAADVCPVERRLRPGCRVDLRVEPPRLRFEERRLRLSGLRAADRTHSTTITTMSLGSSAEKIWPTGIDMRGTSGVVGVGVGIAIAGPIGSWLTDLQQVHSHRCMENEANGPYSRHTAVWLVVLVLTADLFESRLAFLEAAMYEPAVFVEPLGYQPVEFLDIPPMSGSPATNTISQAPSESTLSSEDREQLARTARDYITRLVRSRDGAADDVELVIHDLEAVPVLV